MKLDTIEILSKFDEARDDEPDVTALVINGAVLVQISAPRESTLLESTVEMNSLSNLLAIMKRSRISRMDIVFDVHREKSIKASARETRGTVTQRYESRKRHQSLKNGVIFCV